MGGLRVGDWVGWNEMHAIRRSMGIFWGLVLLIRVR